MRDGRVLLRPPIETLQSLEPGYGLLGNDTISRFVRRTFFAMENEPCGSN